MLKKTVTYEDFNGNQQVEDVYFNLTKTELLDMASEMPDSVMEAVGDDPEKVDTEAAAKKLIEKMGGKGILDFIKNIVIKAYGIKSEDGRRFEKSEQISKEFSQTMAFETILEEFRTNDIAASEFINAVIPSSMADKIPTAKVEGPKRTATKK